ncbi:MAG: DNA mismatch repair endonuclease MutL, partial [Pirellulaceae bacterium]|nr:DNA mismatch repair endonuclease MutL [Pirellulaceae bacterium]
MADIRLLSPSVINKIAAGEVIERPASVVKELMENSVDAGARRIDVAVEKGGTELVRVADDGGGIKADQLLLAVASHATSKIAGADDLFDVRTLGFRGEALASIAEISQFLIRSRPRAEEAGAQLEVRGGQAGSIVPCGCPVGSVIEVRQLFFNTPVRRKFLRATQTEMGHVTEAFIRIALVHPQIHFTLQHNDRPVYDLPAVDSWRERILTFFGGEIGQALIPVASDDGKVRLTGYVADPNYSRANNRMQYLFLNGRHIRDRSLQHALGEAYRGLLLSGRSPIAFIRLEMPADLVDVNVHPTKLEVRFQDGGRIYSQLLSALRQKFLSTDLTARVKPAPLPADTDPAGALDQTRAAQHRDELVQWAQGQLEGRRPMGDQAAMPPAELGPPAAAGQPPPDEQARQSHLPLGFERFGGRSPEFKP